MVTEKSQHQDFTFNNYTVNPLLPSPPSGDLFISNMFEGGWGLNRDGELIREGGLINFLLLKMGGDLLERGDEIEDFR